MNKPELATAAQASFSRMDLKKVANSDLYYYLDKGRLF